MRSVDLIIWDEAPTQSHFTYKALDRTLRDICENDFAPFSGKTVVMGGDFQQTLPVVPNSSQEDVINLSLPRSHLWKHFQVCPPPPPQRVSCYKIRLLKQYQILILRTNMRLSHSTMEERLFADWLLDVGHGRNIDINGTIPFDAEMRVHDYNTLIEHIYPNIDNLLPPPSYFLNRILCRELLPVRTICNVDSRLGQRMPYEYTI